MEFGTSSTNADFIVSHGYRHILPPRVVNHIPCINLHISFLPFNRGADPNYWSFIDNTPKGVTIHYMDEGIDTGDIIAQEQVCFNDNETLRTSYEKLQAIVTDLFIKNWYSIKNGASGFPQKGKGSYHKSSDSSLGIPLDIPVSQLVDYMTEKELSDNYTSAYKEEINATL